MTRALDFSALATLLLLSAPVLAHDEHGWVERGKFRSPAGQLCCGVEDCHFLPVERLRPVEGGWEVHWDGRTEFVPEKDTLKHTPDGMAHICLPAGGPIRCLFIAPMGS